jgi:hypothetical protein
VADDIPHLLDEERILRELEGLGSTRSEAAGDDLDGPTLARMFRAQARAVKLLEKDALRDSGRSRQSQRAGSGPGSESIAKAPEQ